MVRTSFAQELVLALVILSLAGGLFEIGRVMRARLQVRRDDVFVTAQLRDLRYALELFRRERNHYPTRLDELVGDRWVSPGQILVPGHSLYYHLSGTDQSYELKLENDP